MRTVILVTDSVQPRCLKFNPFTFLQNVQQTSEINYAQCGGFNFFFWVDSHQVLNVEGSYCTAFGKIYLIVHRQSKKK
jgi:hypothetical protein